MTTIILTVLITAWVILGVPAAFMIVLGGKNEDVPLLLLCGPAGWVFLLCCILGII